MRKQVLYTGQPLEETDVLRRFLRGKLPAPPRPSALGAAS